MIRKKFYSLNKKLYWCLKGGHVLRKEIESQSVAKVAEKDNIFFSPITEKGIVTCILPIEHIIFFKVKDYNKIWGICPSYFN